MIRFWEVGEFLYEFRDTPEKFVRILSKIWKNCTKKSQSKHGSLIWDVRIKLGFKSEILIYLNKLLPRGRRKLRIAARLKFLSFATH